MGASVNNYCAVCVCVCVCVVPKKLSFSDHLAKCFLMQCIECSTKLSDNTAIDGFCISYM